MTLTHIKNHETVEFCAMIHKERDSKNGVNHLDKYQNMTNPVSAIVHSENDLSRIFSSTPIGLFLNNLETKKTNLKSVFYAYRFHLLFSKSRD